MISERGACRLSFVTNGGASTGIARGRKLGQHVLFFALHQYIGTVGIIILATYLTAYVFDLFHFLGKPLPSKTMYWILTGTPYYPVQIGLGLLLGWLIGRRVEHRAMLWVWILPLAYLTYAVIAIPTLVPNLIPPAYQAGIGESRWKHYFGWGCGEVHPCFDQAAFTVLFYAAAAYSIGALVARKIPKRHHVASRMESWTFVITGFIFVFISAYELVLAIQQGWKSMYLKLVVMPVGIGAFLMLYAILLRQQSARIIKDRGLGDGTSPHE
jgi:hypothetical protein